MSGLLYKTFFRRNSTFWASIFATAFVTEMVFDSGVDKIFDRINRGKQWKDIAEEYGAF